MEPGPQQDEDLREQGPERGNAHGPISRRKVLKGAHLKGSLALGSVLLVVWAVAAGVTGLGAARNLDVARDHLIAAERSVRDADLSVARDELAVAIDASTDASEQLRRLHVVPLRLVPVVGPNLRAATTLSDTARDVSVATANLLDVAEAVISDDLSNAPGEISLEYLAELGPPLGDLAGVLQRSTEDVAGIEPAGLIGRVADARQRFLEVVEPNLEGVVLAAELMDVLPAFLGGDEPRRYLVGAAALSEIRGSGGLLGSWSVMTAHQGRLSFEEFVDVDEMPQPSTPVAAPSPDFERRYGRYGSLSLWRSANITPDFPAAADVFMQLYEDGGGPPVDGVIVADTVVIQRLAERSGGLSIPGYGRLRPEETLQFVGLDAYADFDDDEERKRVLGVAATSAFAELFLILEGDEVLASMEMLADIANGGHVRINVRDPEMQVILERAGVGGELPAVGGESFGVFANNFAEHKLDFFAEREIEHHVRLGADGVTHAAIDVVLRNTGPTEGYSEVVLGPLIEGAQPGDNHSLLTATCSRSCRFTALPEDAVPAGTERHRQMVDQLIWLAAGETDHLRYETTSEDGWWRDDGRVIVEVDHLVQPAIRTPRLQVRVEIPDGLEVVDVPDGAEIQADEVIWSQSVSGRVHLSFVFAPFDPETG